MKLLSIFSSNFRQESTNSYLHFFFNSLLTFRAYSHTWALPRSALLCISQPKLQQTAPLDVCGRHLWGSGQQRRGNDNCHHLWECRHCRGRPTELWAKSSPIQETFIHFGSRFCVLSDFIFDSRSMVQAVSSQEQVWLFSTFFALVTAWIIKNWICSVYWWHFLSF